MNNKLWFLVGIVMFLITISSALGLSHSVRVVENTDQCLTDCYTIYEVCGLTKDVSVGFEFDKVEVDEKTKKNKGFKEKNVKNVDYSFNRNIVKKGDCELITIKGHKMPYENIDNIPIIDGTKHSEFIWWNSAWQNRIELEQTGMITEEGTITRLEIPDINVLQCNNINLDDLRITWENNSYAEERYIKKYIRNNKAVVYINSTNKTGGNYYMYCNNSLAINNDDGSKVFYFYDEASENVGVNYSKWEFITGGAGVHTFTDQGNSYKVLSTTAGAQTSNITLKLNTSTYKVLYNSTIMVWDFCENKYGTNDWNSYNLFGTENREYQQFCDGGGIFPCNYNRNYLGGNYWNTVSLETFYQLREVINYQNVSGNNLTNYYVNTSIESVNVSVSRNSIRKPYFFTQTQSGAGGDAVSFVSILWVGFGSYSDAFLTIPDLWVNSSSYDSSVLEETTNNYYLTLKRVITTNLTMDGSANITFSIDNNTYDLSIINATTQNITFRTTRILPSVVSDTVTNITWNFNLNVPTHSGSFVTNQTIVNIGLDNCSVFTTRAYNFSILNEDTDALIIGNIDGYFSLYSNETGQYYNFSLTWDNNSTYGLCIYPNTSTYIVDAQYEYSASGYETKNYYWNDITLNNNTQELNFYLTNSTTLVTINVVDQDDNLIEDAYIYIQSYDLGTNTYKTTEIVKTDFKGQSLAQMVLYNQWYRFIVLYKDNIVLTTGVKKILTDSIYLTIELDEDEFNNYDLVNNVFCNVSYNSVTENFMFTWLNPTGSSVLAKLDVYKKEVYYSTLINTSSTSASSGSILLNIGTQTNSTYVGKGYITINNQIFMCGDPYEYIYGGSHQIYGSQGIFMAFLLIIFLVTVGIWSPTASVVLMCVGFFISMITGLFYVSSGILISFIIIGGIVLYKLARRE